MKHSTFKEFLKFEYDRRATKNDKYSLRAFARDVGLPSSMLSNVLNGKKKLSNERAYEVAEKLGLNDKEKKYFIYLNQRDSTKSTKLKFFFDREIKMLPSLRSKKYLQSEQLSTLSEWQYTVIWQACGTDGASVIEIAKKMKITEPEAQVALQKLEQLGLLQSQDEIFKKTDKNIYFESKEPHQLLQKIHKSLLEKAAEAIETQTNNEKFIGTEILSFSKESLAEAEEILNEAFDKIVSLSEEKEHNEHVYGMGIQLVRVTHD